ncbi:hypothetical protein ACIQ7D_34250 [Streptomyces sp. NPDC096310]|uniref:hypothetical protein n=1 Tax=Streptomyces sp. NPDC096310 TaxID=3366082 RepID=UPI00380F7D98
MPNPVACRSVVVFVLGCLHGPDGNHLALLQPHTRTEFERWERARQHRRRLRRRAWWLSTCGARRPEVC